MPKESVKKYKLAAVPDVRTDIETGDLSDREFEVEACPLCFGSGLEVVPGKGARMCECRRRDGYSIRLKMARIPKRYENCYFTSFREANRSLKKAITLGSDFAQRYPAVDCGLLFTGPVGVGKTHLVVSMIHALTERGIPCLFYEFGSLLKEIQDSYNPNTRSSELSVLSPVLTADVLVLDELGASKPTDWVLDTMAHIINTRYNDGKYTVFTTNFLDERSAEGKETLEDRIGVRVRSRIYEMCRTVNITGEDYRRNFDNLRNNLRNGLPA